MVEVKKVAWNASEGLIMEISNRRVSANTWFVNGNISRAFKTLVAIKQSVIQSFTPEERVSLKNVEDKFAKVAPALKNSYSFSFNTQERKLFTVAYSYASKFYSQYNDMLMDLLEDRGYLIGEKSDSSIMKF